MMKDRGARAATCGGVRLHRVLGNSVLSSFVLLNVLFGYNLQQLMTETYRPGHFNEPLPLMAETNTAYVSASEHNDETASGMLWEMMSHEAVADSIEDEEHAPVLGGVVDVNMGNGWMDLNDQWEAQEQAAREAAEAAEAAAAAASALPGQERMESAIAKVKRKSEQLQAKAQEQRAKFDKRQQLIEAAQRKVDERKKVAEREVHDNYRSQDALADARARIDALKNGVRDRTHAARGEGGGGGGGVALETRIYGEKELEIGHVPIRELARPESFNCSRNPVGRPPPIATPSATSPLADAKQAGWFSALVGEEQAPASEDNLVGILDVEDQRQEQFLAYMCSKHLVHIALSLESNYMRGLIALVNSIVSNAACPGNLFFHFPVLAADEPKALKALLDYFPDISYNTYHIDKYNLNKSVRHMGYRSKDLENPLNYARIYLPDMLPKCVKRCIYLDTDMVVLERVEAVWETDLGKYVIASPEFCEYKFHRYFTDYFWSNKSISAAYEKKREACYFNPGMMLFDTAKWRKQDISAKLLYWMDVQKTGPDRIYRLGSLPPFLLVFSGNLKNLEKQWNLHDLGCGCSVHVDPKIAKLLHWSCDGKPWRRLEGKSGKACTNDRLYWAPYDMVGIRAREKKQAEAQAALEAARVSLETSVESNEGNSSKSVTDRQDKASRHMMLSSTSIRLQD